jgi:DNA-binding NarL/FixJ family response regulator
MHPERCCCRVNLEATNESNSAMRVLLIDNQTHVRTAMQFLLDQQPGISIVGTADTSDVVPEQARRLQPDIVLINWELWRKPAPDLLRELRALDARPRVVVFSSRMEAEPAALKSGADAFLCAYDPPETFLSVLRTIGGLAEHEGLGSERDDAGQPAA